MNSALIIILCVVFVIVLVVACVYFLVPSIRNRDIGKKETVQEIAEKEVNNMIVTSVKQQIGDPKKDMEDEKVKKALDYLEKLETDKNIIFDDKELPYIILQLVEFDSKEF